MLISDLPDDCLMIIFNHLHHFEDLHHLIKVYPQWAHLIEPRLTRVKYLLHPSVRNSCYNGDATNYSYYTLYLTDLMILQELNLRKVLPNLKILSIAENALRGCSLEHHEESEKLFKNSPTIKGVIEAYLNPCSKSPFYKNIQMLSTSGHLKKIHHSNVLHQLDLHGIELMDDVNHCAEYFTNLSRLRVTTRQDVFFYDQGQKFVNLKILEFACYSFRYDRGLFPGYLLMDSCPVLESAFLSMDNLTTPCKETIKNDNLKDLVIQETSFYCSQDWSTLRNVLSKFRNLNHLAIRYNRIINDSNVEELITLLPEIKLLDFRGSPNVTKQSADYLEGYCKRSGQSITIYYECGSDEPSEWPKLGHSMDPICFGFNFMENCFFKQFDQLPYFLDTEHESNTSGRCSLQ